MFNSPKLKEWFKKFMDFLLMKKEEKCPVCGSKLMPKGWEGTLRSCSNDGCPFNRAK